MDLGHRLRTLREEKGWTNNRLAIECGLSQSFLRSVELNEKGISVENLHLVCDALGISMRTFFDLPEEATTIELRLQQQIDRLTPGQKETLCLFLEQIP